MPKPKDAIVWNERLVEALTARSHQARQQNRSNWQVWSQGAAKIEAVRADIYTFRNYQETKKIVNFPNGLKPSVADTCRAIIEGTQPIFPEGYLPPSATVEGNPMTNFPFLKRLKRRGGSYAILLAFHLSPVKTLTKDQIIQAAQPYCDEEMRENFHTGRTHGAWSANKTLINNGLLVVQRGGAAYSAAAGGFRSLGANSYTLTQDGINFIAAMLEKYPDIQEEIDRVRGNGNILFAASPTVSVASRSSSLSHWSATSGNSSTPPRSQLKPSAKASEDETSLREWLSTATFYEQKRFRVSKARRLNLHHVCDRINFELKGAGRKLHHESHGSGPSRALFVTLLQIGGTPTHYERPVQPYSTPSSSSRNSLNVGHSSCGGRTLGGAVNALTDRPSANVAAANAAFMRQAVRESSAASSVSSRSASGNGTRGSTDISGGSVRRKRPLPSLATIDESDLKPRAKRIICLDEEPDPAGATQTSIPQRSDKIVISLDDSSDDDLPPPSNLTKTSATSAKLKIDLTHESATGNVPSQGNKEPTGREVTTTARVETIDLVNPNLATTLSNTDTMHLVIAIDDRERNRNDTPRMLRMQLVEQLRAGPLATIWPSCGPRVTVQERSLPAADFAFFCGEEENISYPVWVERKRVNDLVQRSSKRDHWFQFHRLRDALETSEGVYAFLIEGDFRTASKIAPYGTDHEEDAIRSQSHIIDSENGIVKFMVRAVLSSTKARFIQTREEQSTLQAIGALALVCSKKFHPSHGIVPSRESKSARLELECKLKSAGVPWELARSVSDEIGSCKGLELLYRKASNAECRDQLLSHILHDVCATTSTFAGSSRDWSRAIHQIFYSKVSQRIEALEAFEARKEFVENAAVLLGNIHGGMSYDDSVSASFQETSPVERKRRVLIRSPRSEAGFPVLDFEGVEDTFYSVEWVNGSSDPLLSVVTFQTTDGTFQSEPLFVFVMEGDSFVSMHDGLMMQGTEYDDDDYVDCASCVSSKIVKTMQTICPSFVSGGTSTGILLLRGLQTAIDKVARSREFRPSLRPLLDLSLSHLLVGNSNITVIQALRKGDKDIYLKEMALSCLHHHYLVC